MDGGIGPASDREALAEAFAELVETTIGEFDVHEVLQVLVDRCVDVLDVSASGLMLAASDGLQVMVASDSQAKLLELFQVQHDEGPCLDSYQSGEPIVATESGGELDRWATVLPRIRRSRVQQCHRGAASRERPSIRRAEPVRDGRACGSRQHGTDRAGHGEGRRHRDRERPHLP